MSDARKAKKIRSLADLCPDNKNANKGTERGTGLLEHSLRTYGAGRSVLADRNGKLIAGNKTVEGAASIGLERVRVVQTNGQEIVVVQRMDLDLDTDKAAHELAIMDNRTGELSLDWDAANLSSLADTFGMDLQSLGFSEGEFASLSDGVLPGANGPSVLGEDPTQPESINQLRFAKRVVPMTEDEAAALDARLEIYIKEKGTPYGFVRHLLNV